MLAAISRPVLSSCRWRSPPAPSASRAGDVQVLPADHPLHAGCGSQLTCGGEQVGRLRLLAREQQAERFRVEAVAGEDRDLLAERAVARRPPAAKVVVVHRRQVVVDQRIGVDQLERGGERQDRLRRAPDRRGGGKREHRADPLAAGEQRVAHRLLQAGAVRLVGKSHALQVRLDLTTQVLGVDGLDPAHSQGGHYETGSGS